MRPPQACPEVLSWLVPRFRGRGSVLRLDQGQRKIGLRRHLPEVHGENDLLQPSERALGDPAGASAARKSYGIRKVGGAPCGRTPTVRKRERASVRQRLAQRQHLIPAIGPVPGPEKSQFRLDRGVMLQTAASLAFFYGLNHTLRGSVRPFSGFWDGKKFV